MKSIKLTIIFLVLLFATMAHGENPAKEAAEKSLTAITLFIDINSLTRKPMAAKKTTESHQDFAAYGYELVDLSVYTENGDLEGFFLAYQKK